MSSKQQASVTTRWAGRWGFVLAATGSAVGLGNIWKFPYMTGEYGGAAFVLVYLVCIAVLGVPIMMAEIAIGRRGRGSPVDAIRRLAQASGRSAGWSLVGWMAMLCGFLILCFYVVVAGWAFSYVWQSVSGGLSLGGVEAYQQLFAETNADFWRLAGWSTLVAGITMFIVGRGVQEGIEKHVNWMMPGLVILLTLMIVYAMFSGGFTAGIHFLFDFDPSRLTGEALLAAMGHAFFTLSLASGAIITYGAYLPEGRSIARTALLVALCDTLVALMAGLAIFPVIFANGMDPSSGPGLIFMSLPLAFDQMPLGSVVAVVFFVMLSLAALTSSVSMIEATVAFWMARTGAPRHRVALMSGLAMWGMSLLAVASFNVGSDWQLAGMNVFDWLDYLTSRWMMPLGGLLTALLTGYWLDRQLFREEMALSGPGWGLWQLALRYVAPPGIGLVFLDALGWISLDPIAQGPWLLAAILMLAVFGELLSRRRAGQPG